MANNSNDNLKEFITPENVKLYFCKAEIAQRITAAIIDFGIVYGIPGSLVWVLFYFIGTEYYHESLALFILSVARNIYYIYTENSNRHATYGKNVMCLQVVQNSFRPLTTRSILIRNIVKEVSFSQPVMFIFSGVIYTNIDGWTVLLFSFLAISTNLVVFANSDRLSLGDLLAGTLIIRVEQLKIKDDKYIGKNREPFKREQLSYYGIKELLLLEDILRKENNRQSDELKLVVMNKIKLRIGYQGDLIDSQVFLTQFYTAQREYLETQKIQGNVKVDKFSKNLSVLANDLK